MMLKNMEGKFKVRSIGGHELNEPYNKTALVDLHTALQCTDEQDVKKKKDRALTL